MRTSQKASKLPFFEEPFHDRKTYLLSALRYIAQFDGSPKAVFLDPDTGLAPRKPSSTHVDATEVNDFWSKLASGDFFVLYQHQTNFAGRPWIEEKRTATGKSYQRRFIKSKDS